VRQQERAAYDGRVISIRSSVAS